MTVPTDMAVAAGGCCWGMHDLFRPCPGVIATRNRKSTTLDGSSQESHRQVRVVEIAFDRHTLSYRGLLEFFFQIHDSTTLGREHSGSEAERGSVIFCRSKQQRQVAVAALSSGVWRVNVVTEIASAGASSEAEAEYADCSLQRSRDDFNNCHFLRPNWRLPTARRDGRARRDSVRDRAAAVACPAIDRKRRDQLFRYVETLSCH
jgi:peptide-methionine (S)-S-oxide reductase